MRTNQKQKVQKKNMDNSIKELLDSWNNGIKAPITHLSINPLLSHRSFPATNQIILHQVTTERFPNAARRDS
jgi:hypothetical protein